MQKGTVSQWERHFKMQQGSGLSASEYCLQNKLKIGAWYFWKRKLKKSEHTRPTGAFVPVVLSTDQTLEQKLAVRLDNGLHVLFTEDVNLARLSGIIKALRGIQV